MTLIFPDLQEFRHSLSLGQPSCNTYINKNTPFQWVQFYFLLLSGPHLENWAYAYLCSVVVVCRIYRNMLAHRTSCFSIIVLCVNHLTPIHLFCKQDICREFNFSKLILKSKVWVIMEKLEIRPGQRWWYLTSSIDTFLLKTSYWKAEDCECPCCLIIKSILRAVSCDTGFEVRFKAKFWLKESYAF